MSTSMRLISNAGLDWVFIDTESVSPDPTRLGAMLGYAQMIDLPGVVRIPEICKTEVTRVLDLGAAGIICPDVRSPKEARELVRLSKYFPEGERGVALERPHTRYNLSNFTDKAHYMRAANEKNLLICQIESLSGLEHDAQRDDAGAGRSIIAKDNTAQLALFGSTVENVCSDLGIAALDNLHSEVRLIHACASPLILSAASSTPSTIFA